MGVRVAVVCCATSFLLGCFFTHWIADSLTLWQSSVTDEHLYTAATYYSILSTMPRWMDALLVAVMAASAIALIWSFNEGKAGNIMFDGASTFLSLCALVVWVYSCLPNIDLLAERLTASATAPFPTSLKTSTLEIATKNLVCSVALTGVMILQAGRQTSENKDTSANSSLVKKAESSSQVKEEEESAVDHDDDASVPDLGMEMPRGRRRSHHDHLEADLDSVSNTSSTPSLRREGSMKREGSKRNKRRSVVGLNRTKAPPAKSGSGDSR